MFSLYNNAAAGVCEAFRSIRITCMDRQDGLDEGETSALLRPFQLIDVCCTNSSLLHEIHQSSSFSTF